ncbi:hypothetical protein F444_02148 [Phytophthora nicotianae P1976]|uniref:Uncharacterized protein n=1 Tax=Phytophthora nicotianae P1976 TaxID=1317066 RepID=A0A081AYE3_PHYNI|nr:hypothetical protein F444_02148 [Phytophthora nicotianae P1976]
MEDAMNWREAEPSSRTSRNYVQKPTGNSGWRYHTTPYYSRDAPQVELNLGGYAYS